MAGDYEWFHHGLEAYPGTGPSGGVRDTVTQLLGWSCSPAVWSPCEVGGWNPCIRWWKSHWRIRSCNILTPRSRAPVWQDLFVVWISQESAYSEDVRTNDPSTVSIPQSLCQHPHRPVEHFFGTLPNQYHYSTIISSINQSVSLLNSHIKY